MNKTIWIALILIANVAHSQKHMSYAEAVALAMKGDVVWRSAWPTCNFLYNDWEAPQDHPDGIYLYFDESAVERQKPQYATPSIPYVPTSEDKKATDWETSGSFKPPCPPDVLTWEKSGCFAREENPHD